MEISFELFPPKGDVAAKRFETCVDTLAPLGPKYMSVTYGANGTDQGRSLEAIRSLRAKRPDLGVAAHLTCVGASRDEIISNAKDAEAAGARWAVALRGDVPGDGDFVPHENGFSGSVEFVSALRQQTSLRIAVAGYPEPHPDSRGADADIEHLKRKVDAGAEAIITQFFFQNDDFYRFVDRVRGAGIAAKIIPGIMPIHSFEGVARFAAKCGAAIPDRLADRFAKAAEVGATREMALAQCAGQCDGLRAQGVSALHFYTLNKADLTRDVCAALGVGNGTPEDGEQLRRA